MSKRVHPPCLYQFKNCRLLRDHQIIKDDLWVRDGKIIDPEKLFWEERTEADVEVDCQNLMISPGFIDIQINGGFGVDFSSEPEKLSQGVNIVAKGVLEHGVTSFCPTLITLGKDTYRQLLPNVKRQPGGPHGAEVVGVHLEGPFINPEKKGAHEEHLTKTIGPDGIKDVENHYGNLDHVSIITLAPELSGAMDVIEELTKRGIVVSIGHSTAQLPTAEDAAKHGATCITHLFNAMLPFHHRDPGIVGLLTSIKIPRPIFYGIIADGIHTHPTSLRIAYKVHPNGLVLITDAIAAMGLKPGQHRLGPIDVMIDDEKATVVGTKTLAGSIASMDECIRRFKKYTGCNIVEALENSTLHPAQLLGIQHQKGTLDFESDADFVFLDDNLQVHATFIAGKMVSSNTTWEATHISRQLLGK